MDSVKTGKLIARRRKVLQMTQSQIAGKIGVTNRSISKWETGRCLPDASLWQPICELLGVSINELYFGDLQNTDNENTDILNKGGELMTREDNKTLEGALLEIIGFHQTIKRGKYILISILLFMIGILLGLISSNRELGLLVKSSADQWDRFFVGLMAGMSTGLVLLSVILFVYGYSLFNTRVKK